jgi:riboflavin kinase, archaea type
VFPVFVGAVSGALILPAKDVRIHEQRILEIMAPVSLRDALHLKDGDPVTIVIGTPEIGNRDE